MTISFASIKEGSEESRQKRAVRRYLNKKKGKPVDESTVVEGSEEDRQKRAKRIEQKKKGKKEPIEEGVIQGSVAHMEHAVFDHAVHGQDHPDYHIHHIGFNRSSESSGEPRETIHHYIVVHKKPLHSSDHSSHVRFPVHHLTYHDKHDEGKYDIKHVGQLL